MKRSAKSQSPSVREWAFSQEVVQKVFNNYVVWDDSDQRRSAKVLLDTVSQLLKDNPNHENASAITYAIVKDLMSVIRGTSKRPIIKAAIKACEHFLAKGILTLENLRMSFVDASLQRSSIEKNNVWPIIFAELLQWTRVSTVCPLAGKFVVSLYNALRAKGQGEFSLQVDTFKQWLLDLLGQDPAMLEPIKNYIFGPLFKGDRQEAFAFLRSLNLEQLTQSQDLDLNLPHLFQLAALEAGKRVGFVEELGTLIYIV